MLTVADSFQKIKEIMSDFNHYTPLKLIAEDIDHLLHFSTHLQDGLFPVTSMTFDSDQKLFSCLANRFCWEMNDHFDHYESYFRVHTGLTFHHVNNVFKRNFHQKHPVRVLNMLMLSAEKSDDAYSVRMLFSGDIEIDLQVSAIQCTMRDFQHPWPTKNKQEAETHGIQSVCLFTRIPDFFFKYGFRIVEDKSELPDKVFKDCQNCPRLHRCDEVAMVRGRIPRISILGPRQEAQELVRLSG